LKTIKFFLKPFLDNYDFYFLCGDLEEIYSNKKNKNGKVAAELWILFQIIKSLPPIILDNLIWSGTMFKSYLKIAYRNIRKNKIYSFINITGLSVGLACCLIILLFVKYELSFDKFHSKAERIYRVDIEAKNIEETTYEQCVPFPFAKMFRNDFVGAGTITQIFYQTGVQVEFDEKRFVQDNIVFADSSFLNVFEYEFVLGDSEALLKYPDAAVLTEELANKFFGNESPLGKTLKLNTQMEVKIMGVIKNTSKNTHMPVDMIVSLNVLNEEILGFNMNEWGVLHSSNASYVLLSPNVTPEFINNQLKTFVKKHFNEDQAKRYKLYLQPLTEIHLSAKAGGGYNYTTSKETILIFSVIGILIIIIASINFVNLAVAQAIKRSKEVGMRKVIGAHRTQIIRQFMGETLIYTAASFIVSIIVTELISPYASAYLGNNSTLSVFEDWNIIFYLILLFAAVSLLTGLYPAIVLSGFSPIAAFRNKISIGSGKSFSLRNSLVIFQFIISQILIISTIVISKQLEYFKEKDLGFNKNRIVAVNLPLNDQAKLDVVRSRLLQNPDISNVTFCGGAPISDIVANTFFQKVPSNNEERVRVTIKPIDEFYLNTFGIKLIAGRNFERFNPQDSVYKFILNEAALKKIGIINPADAIGQMIQVSRLKGEIVGVTNDYHSTSLRGGIEPVIMSNAFQRFFLEAEIKISANNTAQTMAHIENVWKEVFPEFEFTSNYFEEYLNNLYQIEENFFSIIKVFAAIAIVIGALGLLGLISFMAVQKTKEIGIRKTFGASIGNIFLIMSKEFAKNVMIANIIAWPIAYYLMSNWLQDFAYRIDIKIWMFIVAGFAALAITFLTLSFQALKAAKANPVTALKYE
ncbi:MAG: hypothetical protein A2068_08255, partial [Ignavibacteria bacterium GWB2_35_6b]